MRDAGLLSKWFEENKKDIENARRRERRRMNQAT